jgi:hypothetical protein
VPGFEPSFYISVLEHHLSYELLSHSSCFALMDTIFGSCLSYRR